MNELDKNSQLYEALKNWKEAVTTNQPLSVLANIEQALMAAFNEEEDNRQKRSTLEGEVFDKWNTAFEALVKLEVSVKYEFQKDSLKILRASLTDLFFREYPDMDFRQTDEGS